MEKKKEIHSFLKLSGISKKFSGVPANQDVNLSLYPGEIHALLGENGAGKTTLLHIIIGLLQPDSGEISINGKVVELKSPRIASRLGIGMVHQEFTLVQSMTVTENILLHELDIPFIISKGDQEKRIQKIADQYGIDINPSALICDMSLGEQQRVEILKMLSLGAKLLILDEPTSVLTPQESVSLFETLQLMAKRGRSVLFVSHKLEEVITYSDKISVLRKGKMIATDLDPVNENSDSLTKSMIGKTIERNEERKDTRCSENLLEVKNLWIKMDLGNWKIKGLNLSVRKGEILGIAGIAGNGQKEFAESVAGIRKGDKGSILFRNHEILSESVSKIRSMGISLIPEDRYFTGTSPGLSVSENLILTRYSNFPFCKYFIINWHEVRQYSHDLISKHKISVPHPDVPARPLSGGNLQKLILARELSSGPLLLIAMYATRGLDVQSAQKTHNLLLELVQKGNSIILISEDLDELLSLSHRIVVFNEGVIAGQSDSQLFDKQKIGTLMTGVNSHVLAN